MGEQTNRRTQRRKEKNCKKKLIKKGRGKAVISENK